MSSRQGATPRINLSDFQSRRASSSTTPINPFKPTQPGVKAARTKSPQQPAAGPFSGMRRGEPVAVKREPTTQAATPVQTYYSSSASSSAAPVSPAPLQPRRTVSSATPASASKLSEQPKERLQTWLAKYQDEKIAIFEQQHAGGDSEEDPEMAAMKLDLLTKRIADIKAALAAKEQSPAVSTPTADVHVKRTLGSYPSPMSASTDRGVRSQLPSSDPPASSRNSPDIIVAEQPVAGPSRRSRLVPASPPPEIDDFDIEDAEGEFTDVEELVPPSSPPMPKHAPAPRTPRTLAPQPSVEAQAEEAMQGVDLDAFWSPSPSPSRSPPPPPEFAGRPARNQVTVPPSTSRQSLPAAGVSEAGAVTPRIHQVEKQYAWSKEVNQKLRQVFMLPNFRTHQKEAIDETMAGRDVFVLMPTGGGKSLTYQLPAICSQGKTRGVTFVVSPLISLINDQTRHLIKRNIPAIAYTGDLTRGDKDIAHVELSRPVPYTKVVYVTPEMLSMGSQIQRILRGLEQRKQLARFVIDEAHCVSGWGHDFRSDYLKLGDLRKDYPNIPIMALTATAPEKVQDDIIRVLGIEGCTVLKQSFNRPNLHYEVRPKNKAVLNEIVSFIRAQPPGVSGIVYCSSREKCEIIAKELRDKDIRAWHYHAGMTKGDRRKIQEGWQEHKFEVIVATIAFGMGIDKPDVRYVIHHSLPRSLEGYYQETGRAGRDGKNSTCILFYTYGDSKTIQNLIYNEQSLSSAQKERQLDSLKEVLRFCNNKTDCRRTQILSFFNEKFDAANCNRGCDVCLGREENNFVIEDVSADARAVVDMMRAFRSTERITVINAADCYRGAKGSAGKDLDGNPYHGAGKHWGRGDAERLIQNLVIEGCLKEYITANRNGWSNSYVTVGPHAQDFVDGRRKLMMDFRQAAALKQKKTTKASAAASTGTTGQARVVPLAQLKQTKQPVSNPLSRKRSRQQILEEEQAFDDSAWPSDDDYNPEEEPATAGSVVAGTSTKKRKSTGNDGPLDLEQQCFSELQALQSKHGFTLPDELLQMLAAIMPTNMPALRQVEGLPAGLLKDYGTMILGITVKYHEQRSGGSKQSRETLTQNQRGTASIQSSRRNVRDRLSGFAYDGTSSAQPAATRSAVSSGSGSGTTGGGLGRSRTTLSKGKAAARPRF